MSCLLSLLLLAFPAGAQSTGELPSFEVADVKPSKGDAIRSKGRILPGGRIEMPGAPLKELVMFAYSVQENMIQGLPKWADQARFDIVAKAPPGTSVATLRLMVQSLLVERFKFSMHREEKTRPAYALVVGKNGPKLQAGTGEQQSCSWLMVEGGLRRRECHNMTMAELATQLPGWGNVGINRPVIDETGLKGPYDFHLDMGLGDLVRQKIGEREGQLPSGTVPDSGPTIFAAMEQLGLKLESRNMPLPMIVVDHVEAPSDN